MTAFAPASTVARMLSSLDPPVADEGHVGKLLPDIGDHLGRRGASGDVEDGGTGGDSIGDHVPIGIDDRHYHRDVDDAAHHLERGVARRCR